KRQRRTSRRICQVTGGDNVIDNKNPLMLAAKLIRLVCRDTVGRRTSSIHRRDHQIDEELIWVAGGYDAAAGDAGTQTDRGKSDAEIAQPDAMRFLPDFPRHWTLPKVFSSAAPRSHA